MTTLELASSAMGLSCRTALVSVMLLHASFSQDAMYPIEPRGPVWKPPSNESRFIKDETGARYVGLLFAGISEFNWIVDVRVQNESEGYISTGNLVTYDHVLTSCRAARLMIEKSKFPHKRTKHVEHQWDVDAFTDGTDIVVNYCRNYLFEDAQTDDQLDAKQSGVRYVTLIVPHPQCSRNNLLSDVAVMVMNRGISAVVPRVGYMPVNLDYRLEKTLATEPGYLKESSLCYVASFGRGFYNLATEDDPTISYKIKYRVYSEDWKICTDVYSYICNGYDEEQCKDKIGDANLLCFASRAKAGTVCDHDKGAPVVCRGDVIGIVIRGAKKQHCNNVYRIPFIALKIDGFASFLDQTIEWLDKLVLKYDYKPARNPTDIPPDGSAGNHLESITTVTLPTTAIFITARYLNTNG